MNDPMEGIFYANLDSIEKICGRKGEYKICSFSEEKGLKNLTLWGYYANGFKGVAIEIEINEKCIEKIAYVSNLSELRHNNSDDETVKKILTTKLNKWKNEYEWRYLVKTDNNKNKIGEITKIYFGFPYGNITNLDDMKKKKLFRNTLRKKRNWKNF